MLKVGSVDVEFTKEGGIHTGYMGQNWTDTKGRRISTDDGKLVVDGEVLYDTTEHVFSPRPPL